MALDRISTYGLLASHHQRLEESQKNYRTLTQQVERGGQKSDFYRDFADQSQVAIELQATILRYQNYQQNTALVKARLLQSEALLDQIETAARSFRDDVMVALNPGVAARTVVMNEAPLVMQTIQRLANTRFGGIYVMGGAAVDHPPVDTTAFAQTAQGLSLATNTVYYQGSHQRLSIQMDDDLVVSYGVTADIPGIERLFCSLNLVQGGGHQHAVLGDALTAAEAALSDLDQQKATIGLQVKTIERMEDQQESLIRYSENALQAVASDDLALVILKHRQAEQQLEAIYATLRNSMKTSFVNSMSS